MATAFYFLAFTLLCNLSSLPLLANAISNCGGSCTTLDDCAGQLICINGECNDDPDAGTQICGGGASGGGGGGGDDGSCQSFGTLTCSNGKSGDQYRCSPTITSSTQATLTLNQFYEGGDGGGPSKCDGNYHDDSEPVVALSTGWFNAEPWCGKMITITASDGKSTTAKVVDECDSVNGCDKEHDNQPPCRNNIVDGSQAVWDALGLNTDGEEPVITWAMA